MNGMSMMTHEDNPDIPEGKAILVMDNNGFVGTSTGWPLSGQPALFPKSQAEAIMTCWTYVQVFHPKLDQMPRPECVSDDAKNWIVGQYSMDHRK